ncbi:MAG: hypothetical protein R3Y50_05315 [Rikenellaceae bacterium]
MIFKFRMLSDEDENFIRDYEISYDATIKDLHTLICNDIDYDAEEMCSIFLCDEGWMKLREFTLFDMGVGGSDAIDGDEQSLPVAMDSVLLGQAVRTKFARLLFVFDLFEDRAFFLELLEAKEGEEGKEYPRLLFANGEAPDQFDASQSVANRSIFDEAMDDFSDFGGDDDYYDDEY